MKKSSTSKKPAKRYVRKKLVTPSLPTPDSRRELAESAMQDHPAKARVLSTFAFRDPTDAERKAGGKLKARAKAALARYGKKAA